MLLVDGDSIAEGLGGFFHESPSNKVVAKVGAWPREIVARLVPAGFTPDWVVASLGSNGNTQSEMANLRAFLIQELAKAPNAHWIFVRPYLDPAGSVVENFAKENGQFSISFQPAGDHVHPQSYQKLGADCLAIMQAHDPQGTHLTIIGTLAKNFDPLMKSLIGGRDIHRAAIWGQTKQESLGNPNAVERPGTSLGGIGLWQHTASRRRDLENYAAAHGKPWQDAETQVRFMCSELLGPEAHSWTQTKKTTTLEAATETFLALNERAAVATANLPRRIQGAREALVAIQAAQPQEKPMPDTPAITIQNPNAAPVDQLALFIKSAELKVEDVIRATLIAKGVPSFIIDFAFTQLNQIDLAAMIRHVDLNALLQGLFQKK